MKTLTSVQRAQLPWSLLLDPQTNRAAAYTHTHQLITADASQALLEYACAHVATSAPFDKRAHADGDASGRRPLPAWASPEVLERCVLIWIRRPSGDDPDEAWHALPAR